MSLPFEVYGINLVVKVLRELPGGVQIYCPEGYPVRYGVVVASGDGFDEGGNTFRDMPPVGSIVAFEEAQEGVEGHYFYESEEEYRILRLDAVIIAFPQP